VQKISGTWYGDSVDILQVESILFDIPVTLCLNRDLAQYRQYSGWATIWTVRGSNSGRSKKFFSFPIRPVRLWVLRSLLFNGYRLCFPEVKRPSREIYHSPQSSTETEWRYTYNPPISHQGEDRDYFILFFFKNLPLFVFSVV